MTEKAKDKSKKKKKPVVPEWNKVQTAEGWKRSQQKKEKKKSSK